MIPNDRSILVVSESPAFTQFMKEALEPAPNTKFASQQTSFTAMNGRAPDLTSGFEFVIFDADPDNTEEVQAIKSMIAERVNGTIYVAFTGNDVSLQKARCLSDAGVDEVLPLSIDQDGLRGILEKAAARKNVARAVLTDQQRGTGDLIAVAQARGGAGSTMTAVNLACSLVGRSTFLKKVPKKKVALLDLDLQFGNANVYLDVEDNGGFAGLLEASEPPDTHFLASMLQKHSSGVDVICAPLAMAPLDALRADYVAEILRITRQQYDYVVVDLPRAMVDWVSPVLGAASVLAIVTDTSVPCIRQTRRLIDFVRGDNVGLPVEIIINREKRSMFKSEHVREAEKVLEMSLTHWLPDDPKTARKSVDLGQPVVTSFPKSELAKALRKLASRLTDTMRPAAAANPKNERDSRVQ